MKTFGYCLINLKQELAKGSNKKSFTKSGKSFKGGVIRSEPKIKKSSQ